MRKIPGIPSSNPGLPLCSMHEHPIVLFDGVCNFCNGTVNFLIGLDKKGLFRFAPLQSTVGQTLLSTYKLPLNNFGSFVFIQHQKAYTSSTAVLKMSRRLPWYWQWVQLGWMIPEKWRNYLYQLVAKNRYQWFGKRESCAFPTPEMRGRFLQ